MKAIMRNKPELKDSGIEWIGKIPSSWECCKQKYKIKLINGRAYKDSEFEEDGTYKILRVGNLFSNPTWYTSSLELEDDKYCNDGDLLYAWSMSYGPVIWHGEKVIYHYHIWKTKLSEDMVNKYAYYYLEALTNYIRAESHETTMGFVTMGNMNNSHIVYPKSTEQQVIADYLDDRCAKIDAIIAEAKASIEEYKELKQAVIHQAVIKGIKHNVPLKDSNITWMGSVPETWEESTVLRSISFSGGSQPPASFFIDQPADGYIRLIQNRDYRTDEYKTYVPINSVTKFCTADDVMIGRYGPPVFVIHRGLEGAYNVALMKATPILLDREFMYYYLQDSTLLNYVESFSSRAAGQSGVNTEILRRYPIFIPPLQEQIEIAKYLEQKLADIEEVISEKQSLIEDLEAYKKSLIYEVVTGKRKVVA